MLMIEKIHVVPYETEGLDVLWLLIGVGALKTVFIDSADSEEEAYDLIEQLRNTIVEPPSADDPNILNFIMDDRIKKILQ